MDKLEIIGLNEKKIEDFAKSRNIALKKSKKKWIFFVDLDEKLNKSTSELVKVISDTKADYFKVIRKNYFLGKYVGSENIIRLVKKDSGLWVRRVHEYWKPKKEAIYGGDLPGFYLTHKTASSLASYVAKINYYSDLHAKENKKEGKNSSLFKIIFFPIAKFVAVYIKSGNVVFSIMQSLHSFLSWTKLYLYY